MVVTRVELEHSRKLHQSPKLSAQRALAWLPVTSVKIHFSIPRKKSSLLSHILINYTLNSHQTVTIPVREQNTQYLKHMQKRGYKSRY